MCKVENTKQTLWRLIREHQMNGGQVRNESMAVRFGGHRGLNCFSEQYPVCLLGLTGKDRKINEGCEDTAARVLGISCDEVSELEAGFEFWRPYNERDPFYLLGQETAQQLMQEEVAKHKSSL